MQTIEIHGKDLNQEQSKEISKLLQFDPIKNLEKFIINFDVGMKDIRPNFLIHTVRARMVGISEIMRLFGDA